MNIKTDFTMDELSRKLSESFGLKLIDFVEAKIVGGDFYIHCRIQSNSKLRGRKLFASVAKRVPDFKLKRISSISFAPYGQVLMLDLYPRQKTLSKDTKPLSTPEASNKKHKTKLPQRGSKGNLATSIHGPSNEQDVKRKTFHSNSNNNSKHSCKLPSVVRFFDRVPKRLERTLKNQKQCMLSHLGKYRLMIKHQPSRHIKTARPDETFEVVYLNRNNRAYSVTEILFDKAQVDGAFIRKLTMKPFVKATAPEQAIDRPSLITPRIPTTVGDNMVDPTKLYADMEIKYLLSRVVNREAFKVAYDYVAVRYYHPQDEYLGMTTSPQSPEYVGRDPIDVVKAQLHYFGLPVDETLRTLVLQALERDSVDVETRLRNRCKILRNITFKYTSL